MRWVAQLKQSFRKGQILPSTCLLFYSDSQWMDDPRPHLERKTCLSHQVQCSCHPETSSQTHPEIIAFSHIAGHPVIQSSWLTKLTIRAIYKLRVAHFRTALEILIRKGSCCPSMARQLGKMSTAQGPTESWYFWKIFGYTISSLSTTFWAGVVFNLCLFLHFNIKSLLA